MQQLHLQGIATCYVVDVAVVCAWCARDVRVHACVHAYFPLVPVSWASSVSAVHWAHDFI